MQFFDAIRNRRTIKRFTSRVVDIEAYRAGLAEFGLHRLETL